MMTVLSTFALLVLGGPHACAKSGAVHPSATIDCSSSSLSAQQLRNCAKTAAGAGDVISSEVYEETVSITHSVTSSFPFPEASNRHLLTDRRAKSRDTRRSKGRRTTGNSPPSGGSNPDPPSNPPSDSFQDPAFPTVSDSLEPSEDPEPSSGSQSEPSGEEDSSEEPPANDDAVSSHDFDGNHEFAGDSGEVTDGSGNVLSGNDGGEFLGSDYFPSDSGDGGSDGSGGSDYVSDGFSEDGGFDVQSLNGDGGGSGANGGQDTFSEEEVGDSGEESGELDGGEAQPPGQQGDGSGSGLDGSGSEDSSPLASFTEDSGAPPRSGNGKAFEQCPSNGKWNIKDWNLEELVGKNFYFFEAQESGELPEGNRVKWRGNSYLNDKHRDRLLNYGWFDAGDHLKLMFPMGWTISTMAWSIIDGQQWLTNQQYDGKSNLQWAIQTLEYGLEFLLDCSFENGEFVAQIGETDIDHWHVFRAEKDDFTPRTEFVTLPPMTPGSDLLYQAAAAYASGALALRQAGGSTQLAARAEKQAREIYIQADANPGIFSHSVPELGVTYDSDSWQQYGFLASAWMFRLTGENMYKVEADGFYTTAGINGKDLWADYSWNSVYMGGAAVMWQATGEEKYEQKMAYFAKQQINAVGNIRHTPKGLMYMAEWGPLRYAAGGAGIMAMYARGLKGENASNGMTAEEIMAFAEHQLAYILGATGHSYVAGYGCNPPRNPHHRNACLTLQESDDQMMFDSKEFNEYELTGAVVGGPDINDNWNDDRKDYKRTEVALDYNAALFFAAVQVGR